MPLVLAFHTRYLTEHLWPRTLEEFKKLATDECLYVAFESTANGEELVGICFVMGAPEPESPNTERLEFGGVYVTDDCRGYGVASYLGVVAISNHHVWDPPIGRLIAHVHEANLMPRGMLQNQLGFTLVGQEIPPSDKAPHSMARNKDGNVVGDLFQFDPAKLLQFADWIEKFSGTIGGKSGESNLHIDLRAFSDLREEIVEALRSLGEARRK